MDISTLDPMVVYVVIAALLIASIATKWPWGKKWRVVASVLLVLTMISIAAEAMNVPMLNVLGTILSGIQTVLRAAGWLFGFLSEALYFLGGEKG